jgi:hypothetical protein
MKNILALTLALGALVVLTGCNAGSAPEPMADADVKKTIDGMSPEQRIKFIEGSPASPEEKARQIAEIKAQNGIK